MAKAVPGKTPARTPRKRPMRPLEGGNGGDESRPLNPRNSASDPEAGHDRFGAGVMEDMAPEASSPTEASFSELASLSASRIRSDSALRRSVTSSTSMV